MLGRYTTGPCGEGGGYQTVPRYPRGPMPVIDLRSDTVTKPTPEMRRAMAEAEVGDDVFGDDPTVIALEERAAELLGKEAGLFVASGAMGNLAAQMAHVARGQEIIAGEQSHIVLHEAASHAVVVGASVRVIREQPDGTLDPAEVAAAFRDPGDIHEPITGLVAIENASASTMNQPLSVEYTRQIAAVAHDGGVPLHVDGARFWTAWWHSTPTRASWPDRRTASRSACRRGSPARLGAWSWVRGTSSGGRVEPGSSSVAGCARSASSPPRGWSRCGTARPG
jgi:Beta-eliminating lyase